MNFSAVEHPPEILFERCAFAQKCGTAVCRRCCVKPDAVVIYAPYIYGIGNGVIVHRYCPAVISVKTVSVPYFLFDLVFKVVKELIKLCFFRLV